nr:putative phospholipid-transporting atpase dnf3 [Quercus suber]
MGTCRDVAILEFGPNGRRYGMSLAPTSTPRNGPLRVGCVCCTKSLHACCKSPWTSSRFVHMQAGKDAKVERFEWLARNGKASRGRGGDADPVRQHGDGMRRRHSSHEHPELELSARVSVENEAPPPRVRFSIDTDRRPMKRRKSDEMSRETVAQPGTRGPALAVDTRVAQVMGREGRHGTSLLGSPSNMTSPNRDDPSRLSSSPMSPRSARNRGLSLRSSLFAKNMNTRMSGDPGIEMAAMGSSSSDPERPQTANKKRTTSITITPVQERSRSTSPLPPGNPSTAYRPSSRKGVQRLPSALPHYQQWVQSRARRHFPVDRVKDVYERARKFVLRIQDIPPSKDGRKITLDPTRKQPLIDERTTKPYVGNLIRSSKYSAWNFLPRQLFAQFSKLANFYFLCVSILQMIPGLSTTGTYTTIIPLLIFVSLSMAKEGYDDLRRYRLDKAENNRQTRVLHAYRSTAEASPADIDQSSPLGGLIHWAPVKWHSLQVGDVVKLERDEAAPADLVLLNSRGPNNVAYIETMALDGETNLKNKQAAASLVSAYQSVESVAAGGADFVVEDPNLDLYKFEGRVTIHGETVPLTNNEIIYRGSVLRNTPEILGMVIYSGEECKIRMNATKNPRIKAPSLQALVNKIVVIVVIFVVLLALYNTIAYEIWQDAVESSAWYLTDASVAFGPILTSFIIMFNTMVPLSLYVSLEVIKIGQMLLMNDVDMYDEASNTPFEARTSTINEELGQVSYIFSDKTGTLTENVMKFRKMSVAGTAWVHDDDLKAQGEQEDMLMHKKRSTKSKGKRPVSQYLPRTSTSQPFVDTPSEAVGHDELENTHLPRRSTSLWKSSAMPGKSQPELSTQELIRYIQRRPNTAFARKAKMMILSMAVCHTCLPEKNQMTDRIDYQASSPDELALVTAAQEMGYVAWEREVSRLTIQTFPAGAAGPAEFEVYEVLDVIEFSSKRKRMSCIVRFPNGRICVMCKGADSVVMTRLRLAALAHQKTLDIEDRNDKRRSIEAHQALERKSTQITRSGSVASFARTSMNLRRMSGSRSTTGKMAPIRDHVDIWLKDREQDVPSTPMDPTHYSPRPSAQLGRPSMARSDYQQSVISEYADDDLVEEALVVDEAAVIERCLQHINDFATEGLRTLLYAHRFLEDEEYQSWKKLYQDATTSLVNRQVLIERAGEVIEQQLELGGATAIEDKLQKGVPETIDRLRRANIKLWMLTGDKRETAINIGHSCKLIKDYSAVTVLDHETGDAEQCIAAAIIDINHGTVPHSVVVIDGQTLAMLESDRALYTLFQDLAILADSVVCCRASPSQKASLVNGIRRRVSGSVTLAIGDGANDIAMIQEAHVGIGITGKEGLQAARTSDYSIAQFRFLTKLLLVHGRWNYIRTCLYTVSTLWKEMFFFLLQALYQRSTGYTGTSLYESWSLSMFNTLFSSLIVIFVGIFEKDLHESTLIAVPELYTKGQRSAGFNFKVYLWWMFTAAAEAMIIYYTMYGLFATAIFTLDNGVFAMGDLAFTACIIVIATKVQVIVQHNKTHTTAIAWLISVGGWFLWNIILAASYKKNGQYNVKDGFFDRFGRNALWWLVLILATSACLLFEVALAALHAAFRPSDAEVFQELEADLATRRRFEEASAPWLQAGWKHGGKKSSLELARELESQADREGAVQALLDRPRVMEEGRRDVRAMVETEEQRVLVDDGRTSTDIQEVLARRFGGVRQETLMSPS